MIAHLITIAIGFINEDLYVAALDVSIKTRTRPIREIHHRGREDAMDLGIVPVDMSKIPRVRGSPPFLLGPCVVAVEVRPLLELPSSPPDTKCGELRGQTTCRHETCDIIRGHSEAWPVASMRHCNPTYGD
jgi:hypothetical protein